MAWGWGEPKQKRNRLQTITGITIQRASGPHQRLLSYMVSSLGATWPQGPRCQPANTCSTGTGNVSGWCVVPRRGASYDLRKGVHRSPHQGPGAGLDSPPPLLQSILVKPQRKTLSSRHVGNPVRRPRVSNRGHKYSVPLKKVQVKLHPPPCALETEPRRKNKNKEKTKGKPRIITTSEHGAMDWWRTLPPTAHTWDGDGGELGPPPPPSG
jgi:hypothetical protein